MVFGARLEIFLVTMLPALLNNRSEGTEVAVMQWYLRTSFDIVLNLCSLTFQKSNGLSVLGTSFSA